MAENVNPATMGGAREVAKAGRLATPRIARNGARVTFEGATGPETVIVKGRELWALRALMAAGSQGVTPVERPAPRWSAYVHGLREMGLEIETIREEHGGDFPGFHGRYVLRSPVAIEGGAA